MYSLKQSCKYCGADKLYWSFNILTKKWELLDAHDNKHKCRIEQKPNNKNTEEFKRDPKIKKALEVFKKQLDNDKSKKIYWLKKY